MCVCKSRKNRPFVFYILVGRGGGPRVRGIFTINKVIRGKIVFLDYFPKITLAFSST